MKSIEKIKAKKSLGQNFLTDIDTLHTIADFFEIYWKSIVEVGPGYGALTEYLLNKNPRDISLIELDSDMVEILKKRQDANELPLWNANFQLFHQDILRFEPSFSDNEYVVIANIPYYITSPILRRFLYEVKNKPSKMLILMQKEVGEKILEGQLGNKRGVIKTSVLSLIVAKKAKVERVIDVPSYFFRPAPKVDSIVIAFYRDEIKDNIEDDIFLEFIKKAFAEPRKKLSSNLKKAWYEKNLIEKFLLENNLDLNVRPEDLNLEYYIKIIKAIR